uniref:WD repeat-containing protein 93 isoform X2 n=1 Tax=Pristiophorus japonicus TaxID=55135 RepID=UPI00398EEA11
MPGMPGYIKKYPVVSNPLEHNWSDDNENDDYLKDPDQRLDKLPQPFRMIDKLIGRIIENACESIEGREAEREAKRLKIKPPLCESSEEIQLPGNLNCLANTVDANYIFAGLSEGVAVLNTEDHTVTSVWTSGDVEIVALQVTHAGGQLYLLAAVDDMGIARLLFSYGDIFSTVKVFNAADNVIERNSCSKFELSEGGDYAGITLEGKGESWLEVYRLVKDNWAHELDQFVKQMALHEQSGHTNPPSLQDIKLTPPVLVLKLRPKQITDCLWKNPFDALQKLDDANIIGTGQNHVIIAQQWIEEKKIFEEMYKTYLSKGTTEEFEEKQSQATFHFYTLGRLLPVGLENKTQVGYLLRLYIPSKVTSELEPKADIVWPNASSITCSAVKICASLLVIAFADGTIAIWDLYLGIPVSVLSISEDSHIMGLHFLESSFCVPFGSSDGDTKAQVLVTCKNGAVYLATATEHTSSISTLRERSEEPGDIISAVALVPQLSKFLLIFTNGTTALLDKARGDTLCHCIFPFPHVIASPWEPVFAFDRDGSFLFIKGDKKMSEEALDRKESSSSLFAFSLLFLFPLDICTKKKELPRPPTQNIWEKRCERFLQERLKSVMSRNEEMTARWNQLQHHAILVNKEREHKKKTACLFVKKKLL